MNNVNNVNNVNNLNTETGLVFEGFSDDWGEDGRELRVRSYKHRNAELLPILVYK